ICQSLSVGRYVTAQNISNLHLLEHKDDNCSPHTPNTLRTDSSCYR
ncbi:11664_t:CDS:1, partial [Entrophospora sp. SA101]